MKATVQLRVKKSQWINSVIIQPKWSQYVCLNFVLTLTPDLYLKVRINLFLSGFPFKIPYALLASTNADVHTTHPTLFYFIAEIILHEI